MIALLDNDNSWAKYSHGIQLNTSFKTYKEAVAFALEEDVLLDDNVDDLTTSLPEYFTKANQSDSSVGGNDAINPYWQFGVDDDIVHPITSTDGIGNQGMGRVYSENYDQNQQILWLSMGVPEFSNLSDFYKDSADPEIAKLMSKGDLTSTTGLQLGNFLGSAGKLAFQLPFMPFIWMNKLANYVLNGPKSISKYYDFKSSMTLYYRMANIIMSHLAVGMGLYGNGASSDGETESTTERYSEAGIPEIMKNGPDIFAIMNKRAARVTGTKTTDDLIKELSKKQEEASFWDKLVGGFAGSALGASDYVGFKVERSTDASETISNTTGASSIVETLNGNAASVRDKKFMMAGGTGIGVIDATVTSAIDLAKGVIAGLGGTGGVEVMSGNGYYDIPDVWKSSSFSKSYNFNIQLRSRYGDPVSIYQSVYIPLAMLLAAALPRGIGKNMYTSPFLIKGYCKGMFSIPLGIIESLSIKRGAPEFGWSADTLPTSVDVTLNIKDLSPAMFLNLSDRSIIKDSVLDAFGRNDGMQEYLTTLSGLGTFERVSQIDTIRRKRKITQLINKNTVFSPLYQGMTFGRSTIPRALARVLPWESKIPKN